MLAAYPRMIQHVSTEYSKAREHLLPCCQMESGFLRTEGPLRDPRGRCNGRNFCHYSCKLPYLASKFLKSRGEGEEGSWEVL